MNTRCPFSFISYNSPEFLKAYLDDLVTDGWLDVYGFIRHNGEPKSDDPKAQDDLKDHIHCWCSPGRQFDTGKRFKDCGELFVGETLPRRCIGFKSSKFDHWYLYSMHNEKYLDFKELTRAFHYLSEDFVVSDPDAWGYLVRSIDYGKIYGQAEYVRLIQEGLTSPLDLVAAGSMSPTQANALQNLIRHDTANTLKRWDDLESLRYRQCERAALASENKSGETVESIDPESGEFVPF